ncbi:hypothetical protein M378DRAFT_12897 [Amanita muscaria Koide BX008]|uniref:NACHT domain-containing protein n=1 Tax=Amanita muscaria (strain Koide BX008) TaxID=946122 RepID=A0A0C2SGQ2_AMAMK|nr:hypothetical protein M378DRAFT_12897 [Amanita muscaria Koide BX008]
MDRGGEGAHNAKVGHGVDPCIPSPTDASTVATEPCSGVRRDRDTGSEEVPFITMFEGSSNLQISNTNINAIGDNATIIRFGETHVQLRWLIHEFANLTVLPDINNILEKHVLTQSIISLPRAEAVFNDYQTKKKSGPCFEGTRVALLREMADWVTVPDESRMYVLSGLAGIGKSTVAHTIASRAVDLNLLGASFFFSRGEADRNNAKRFFTISTLHRARSAATTKGPQDQLQALILDPLRSIVQSRSWPILIVVDALDECDEEGASSTLAGLSQLVRDLPSFKVILTTRPQSYLDPFWATIKSFAFKTLKISPKAFSNRQWCATDEKIDSLVHAAGRLFIISSTAGRYILDKSANSESGALIGAVRDVGDVTAVCALAVTKLACGFEDGSRDLCFGPDGGLFVSGSDDGTIKLWNGEDGSLRGTLSAPSGAAGGGTLEQRAGCSRGWRCHCGVLTRKDSEDSEDSDESEDGGDDKDDDDDVLGQSNVSLFDVMNHTTIATFNVPHDIDTISFLPDNLQIVAQTRGGVSYHSTSSTRTS